MKKQTAIEALKKYEPFTADELTVLKKAINAFSTGGHRMPGKSAIGGFAKKWVVNLLKKSGRMLEAVAKSPAYEKDLRIVRELIQRFNRKSKLN